LNGVVWLRKDRMHLLARKRENWGRIFDYRYLVAMSAGYIEADRFHELSRRAEVCCVLGGECDFLDVDFEERLMMARILIIEDTKLNIDLFTTLLTYAGHVTFVAECALPGIEMAQTMSPDLILMDIQMLGMDGIQATQILRADPRTQNIPIAAVTALAMSGDRERLLSIGFDAYIPKPIDTEQFIADVVKLIEVGRSR